MAIHYRARVAWLSRHNMTQEESESLHEYLESEFDGRDEETDTYSVEIEYVPVHWKSSDDEFADIEENTQKWKLLMANYNCVVGIFPPVAMEALRTIRRAIPILTPVTTRVVKNKEIHIKFHRWIHL